MRRKNMLCVVVALLLYLLPAAVGQASIDRINHEYFVELRVLQGFHDFEAVYDEERYGEARDLLNQVIADYPDEAYLYYIRGNLSWEMGEYAAVREDMDGYLAFAPDDVNGYKLNMFACAALADYRAALENCRAGLALTENDRDLNLYYDKLAAVESEQAAQEDMAAMSGQDIAAQARAVCDIVNEERESAGLPALRLHDGLNQAALVRAEEITDVFSHTRPNGENFFTVLQASNIPYQTVGENIAAGMSTAEEVMTGWMESPGHRENIMKPDYRYIGIGYVYKNGTAHWVQLFMN